MTRTLQDGERFLALDGARGWAAAAVILYHAILQYSPALNANVGDPPAQLLGLEGVISKTALTLFNGQVAVTLFFIISGFVLSRSLQARANLNLREAAAFSVRRVFRLMPSIFVSVLAIYRLTLAQVHFNHGTAPTFDAVLRNMVLLDVGVHGVTWTIQVEMLAVPVVFGIALATRYFFTVGAVCGVIYGLLATQNHGLSFHHLGLATAVLPFSLGMLVAEPGCRRMFERAGTVEAISVLLLFIFMRFFEYQAQIMASLAQTLAGALPVAILAYSNGNSISASLESNFSQFLGRISYSLYLSGPIVGSSIVFGLGYVWAVPPMHPLAWASSSALLQPPSRYLSQH
ncbi:acyltransferase family protein [Roseomonas sp. WA12]